MDFESPRTRSQSKSTWCRKASLKLWILTMSPSNSTQVLLPMSTCFITALWNLQVTDCSICLRTTREPGSEWSPLSSIVRNEKVMSSALNDPPDAARIARRPSEAVLGLAPVAVAAAAAGACAGAPSTSMPSPNTRPAKGPLNHLSHCCRLRGHAALPAVAVRSVPSADHHRSSVEKAY
jgi:hypothetical protein